MQNVTFHRTVIAQINLTPSQWELYTSSMDCTDAAKALNWAAEEAISSSTNASEAVRKLSHALKQYAEFGAWDSEPMWVAQRLCCLAFGEEC